MMAAAGMRDAGNFPSAYDSGAKFSDAEMSKNLDDRRGQDDMGQLASSIEATLKGQKARSDTPGDVAYDTMTKRRQGAATPRHSERSATPR
jgi:hypothetical protein